MLSNTRTNLFPILVVNYFGARHLSCPYTIQLKANYNKLATASKKCILLGGNN